MHHAAYSFQESEPLGGMRHAKLFIILLDKALKDPVQTFQDRLAVGRSLFPWNRNELSPRANAEQQA
jgi:hypothetical protein